MLTATGQQLAEHGGQQALDHAQRVSNMTWAERATWAILYFMERRPVFTIEQVKDFAYAKGLPKPPADGAWGPVVKKLANSKRLKSDGVVRSTHPSQHGKWVTVWRVQ